MLHNELRQFQNLLALSAATLIIIVWSTVTYLALNNRKTQSNIVRINTYEECVGAGNTILESYPAVCVTKNGKRFVQDINKVNDSVTNNWKTYKSEKYNYEVSYPSDWIYKELNQDYIYFNPSDVSTNIQLMSVEVTNSKSIFNPVWIEYTTIRNVIVSGKVIEIKKYKSGPSTHKYIASIKNGDNTFTFKYSVYASKKYETYFDQILSTFRFDPGL